MREPDQLLWALDNAISPTAFERLCVDLLGREGYRHIVPVGGAKDRGRDAELRYWVGASEKCPSIVFQFSLDERWEAKLKRDAAKIAKHRQDVSALVFVTSRRVTGVKQDELEREFQSRRGWELVIYSREWLRHRLTEAHHDLATSYFGLSLHPTPGFAAVQFERCALDDYSAAKILRHTSPELLRATLAGRTEKEPGIAEHWFELARVQFLLRNYDGALHALSRAFGLTPTDDLLVLNMTLFKATLLAEKGIEQHSRPLLIQAKDALLKAMPGRKRAADHYNLANILGALGETREAKKEYAHCLVLEQDHAQAWKNFGSLLVQEGDFDAGLECFDHALNHQPDLVEAHLSKATTLLICLGRPDESIVCFEAALGLAQVTDLKWPYVGYWFSRALSAVGRHDEALVQVERELSVRPDDIHLLDQKAAVLVELRRLDRRHEEKALEFFKFRADALPHDFFGLSYLIEILQERGDEAFSWPFINVNLQCEPFSVQELATQAGISVGDLLFGFRHAELYGTFRSRFSLEDHCVALHEYGLSPDSRLLPALDYVLMAPFGVAAVKLAAASKSDVAAVEVVSEATLNTMSGLFPAFGSFWLARSEPEDFKEKTRLLSIGVCYLADVVVAETARQIGFLRGCYRLPNEKIFGADRPRWGELRAEVGVRLFDKVTKDWHLGQENA